MCKQQNTQARECTLVLKPRAEVDRSPKQGYQWPHKKDLSVSHVILDVFYLRVGYDGSGN